MHVRAHGVFGLRVIRFLALGRVFGRSLPGVVIFNSLVFLFFLGMLFNQLSTLKLMLHIAVGLRNIIDKKNWRDSLQAWVVKNNNFRNSGKQLSGLRGL